MTRSKNSIDIVNGPLLKNIFIFAIPLMFTNFLQMLFNAADTIVVGKFAGEDALAAVGATGSLVFLLVALFQGIATGTNVVVAKYIGAKDDDKVSKAVSNALLITLVSGIFLMIVGYFGSRPLLAMMSTPDNIIDLSALYMEIYFAGSISVLGYNFGSAILRAKGDTKRPLYFLMISGILNVVLNLFFVIVLHMSVAGVAIATIISQTVAFVLILYVLINEEDATHFDPRTLFNADWSIIKETMLIGIPAGIQSCAYSISNVVVQSSINSFGSTIVAGNSAASNIENFVYIGMMAFTQATITFTSQNVGARRYSAIKRIMIVTLILDVASALVIGVPVWYSGRFFLSFYTNEAAVIEAGMVRLTWVALFLSLNAILDIFVNSLRGMGYSTVPTIFMIGGVCGVRLAWLLLYFPLHRELSIIYMCYPISWSISSIIEFIIWITDYHKLMKQVKGS